MRCSAKRSPVELFEERTDGSTRDGPEDLRRAQPVQDERPPVGDLQGLRQEVGVVVHLDALVAEGLGERVVLLAGSLGPHDVVEEQALDVVRRQPVEFDARPVQDRPPELPDL